MSEAKRTTNHETIQNWAEARGGRAAVAEGTSAGGTGAGVLRIDFQNDDSLRDISWEDFFKTFDEQNLAFLYQEETDDGEESRFCKLVSRDA